MLFVDLVNHDFSNKNTTTKVFKPSKNTKNSCYKNMHMYCKNCKKHTGNTFTKKLILISKSKIKGKSKCAICLTEKTFIHDIDGKYDLERELEIYLPFFTD